MPTPLPTTGGRFTQDKTGVCRIELPYVFDGPSAHEGPEPWEDMRSWVPSEYPMGLPIVGRSAGKDDSGQWVLSLVFEGAPDGGLGVEVVELDDSSVEEPIEAHPKFKELAKKYSAVIEAGKFEGWSQTYKDPGTGKTGANPMFGQSHYLSGNPVLRLTYNKRTVDSGFRRNLRKIDDPPVSGELKELSNGETWLKRSAKVTPKGNVWQYVIDWIAGNWNPDVYGPES